MTIISTKSPINLPQAPARVGGADSDGHNDASKASRATVAKPVVFKLTETMGDNVNAYAQAQLQLLSRESSWPALAGPSHSEIVICQAYQRKIVKRRTRSFYMGFFKLSLLIMESIPPRLSHE
jgi:hypothetical protein